MWISLAVFSLTAFAVTAQGPASAPGRPATSGPGAAPAGSSASPRALLDQYCVTCHNDRVKTANLSLQGADLSAIGQHAELWERVVRKLRAGVMPPPDVPRPSLADYDGLRD